MSLGPERPAGSDVLFIPDIPSIDIVRDEARQNMQRIEAGEITAIRLGVPFMSSLGDNLAAYLEDLPEDDEVRQHALKLIDFEKVRAARAGTRDISLPEDATPYAKSHFYWSQVIHFLAATCELDFVVDPAEQFETPIAIERINGRKTFSRQTIMTGADPTRNDTAVIDNDVTAPLSAELIYVKSPDAIEQPDPLVVRMKYFAERLLGLRELIHKRESDFIGVERVPLTDDEKRKIAGEWAFLRTIMIGIKIGAIDTLPEAETAVT